MAKRAKKLPDLPAYVPPSPEVQAEIDRRLAMQYSYELVFEDGKWFARIVEFPGCMSDGDDPTEAIRMVREAAEGWLQCMIEDGYPVPDPIVEDDYSGRFLTRVPSMLHRDLARRAEREGVSLNLFVATALARALGQA